jgi:hypothetical protein
VPAPPSADTLARELGALLADRKRRSELAAGGRRAYVERFTARPWAEATRGLYDDVLAERGGSNGTRART